MLNEAQRGRLAIVLRAIEDELCEIERFMDRPESPRLLSQVHDDLSPATRATLKGRIPAVYEVIRRLRTHFHLPQEVRSVSRRIIGNLSLLWVALQESDSRRLHGYGAVDAVDAQVLDPDIEMLAGQLRVIEEAVLPTPQPNESTREPDGRPEDLLPR